MSTLFRFIPRVGASIDPRLDKLVAEPEVTVGCSPDAGLQLKKAGLRFNHAVIREDGQFLMLEALPGATLKKDGADTARVTLRPGDTVRIGAYLLALQEADPMGLADHVVTVTAAEEGAFDEATQAKSYMGLFDVGLPNIRLYGFVLSVIVFALFFIIPVAFGPTKLGSSWTTKEGRSEQALSVHSNMFQSAIAWNVGEMSSAHKAFGTNCKSCHESPIIPVRSSSCLACHSGIGQHADPL